MRIEFTRTYHHTQKRADVSIVFDQAEGPILAGGRLDGFGLFETSGGEMRVTFPARKYEVNGQSRAYALLRNVPAIESVILRAWRDETLPERYRNQGRDPIGLDAERTRARERARRTRRSVKLSNGGSIEPSGFEWAPDEPAQVKP